MPANSVNYTDIVLISDAILAEDSDMQISTEIWILPIPELYGLALIIKSTYRYFHTVVISGNV